LLRDPFRGRSHLRWYLRWLPSLLVFGPYTSPSVTEDIVIEDSTGNEVFRQGPYTQGSVGSAVNRIVAEVNRDGLEAFLASHRVPFEEGPIVRASDRRNLGQQFTETLRYYWLRLTLGRRKHSPTGGDGPRAIQ
jgi:hypothetical protein